MNWGNMLMQFLVAQGGSFMSVKSFEELARLSNVITHKTKIRAKCKIFEIYVGILKVDHNLKCK
jgi:hypothetical protein